MNITTLHQYLKRLYNSDTRHKVDPEKINGGRCFENTMSLITHLIKDNLFDSDELKLGLFLPAVGNQIHPNISILSKDEQHASVARMILSIPTYWVFHTILLINDSTIVDFSLNEEYFITDVNQYLQIFNVNNQITPELHIHSLGEAFQIFTVYSNCVFQNLPFDARNCVTSIVNDSQEEIEPNSESYTLK